LGFGRKRTTVKTLRGWNVKDKDIEKKRSSARSAVVEISRE